MQWLLCHKEGMIRGSSAMRMLRRTCQGKYVLRVVSQRFGLDHVPKNRELRLIVFTCFHCKWLE